MELCPLRVTVDAQSSMHPRQKSPPHPPGRRNSQGCDQPLIRADVVEQQLVTFVADFKPDPKLRDEILRRLADTNTSETKETAGSGQPSRNDCAGFATFTSSAISSG